MGTAGFDCPSGTRIIIQRPDGYFTALVQGTARIRHDIVPGQPFGPLAAVDELVGVNLDLDIKIDKDENGNYYTVALGKYEED